MQWLNCTQGTANSPDSTCQLGLVFAGPHKIERLRLCEIELTDFMEKSMKETLRNILLPFLITQT